MDGTSASWVGDKDGGLRGRLRVILYLVRWFGNIECQSECKNEVRKETGMAFGFGSSTAANGVPPVLLLHREATTKIAKSSEADSSLVCCCSANSDPEWPVCPRCDAG